MWYLNRVIMRQVFDNLLSRAVIGPLSLSYSDFVAKVTEFGRQFIQRRYVIDDVFFIVDIIASASGTGLVFKKSVNAKCFP